MPLRERGSERYNSFIVLAFFNGVTMSHTKQSVPDYFFKNIINGTNLELSVMLEKITVLTKLIPAVSAEEKDILSFIILDYAEKIDETIHSAEELHLGNVMKLEVSNG